MTGRFVFCAVLLASPWAFAENEPYELSAVESKAVHGAVRTAMPDAAEIGGLLAADSNGDVVVCGIATVEGEDRPFIGLLYSEGSRAEFQVMPTPGSPNDPDIIRLMCHARGVPLP